jgi:glycerol-3-phosphate dehydrogenase
VRGIGDTEHLLPGVTHRGIPPIVHGGLRYQPDSRVAVRAVVPGEECLAEDAGVLDIAEACREVSAVF